MLTFTFFWHKFDSVTYYYVFGNILDFGWKGHQKLEIINEVMSLPNLNSRNVL